MTRILFSTSNQMIDNLFSNLFTITRYFIHIIVLRIFLRISNDNLKLFELNMNSFYHLQQQKINRQTKKKPEVLNVARTTVIIIIACL